MQLQPDRIMQNVMIRTTDNFLIVLTAFHLIIRSDQYIDYTKKGAPEGTLFLFYYIACTVIDTDIRSSLVHTLKGRSHDPSSGDKLLDPVC